MTADEDLTGSERERFIIRNTPVVDAKYLDVWHRAFSKIKVQLMLKRFSSEI
jgi:hypothetical protein